MFAIALGNGVGPIAASAAQDGPGVTGPTSYVSPGFGYEVTWDETWTVVPDLTNSDQGLDGLTLDSELIAQVQIFGVDPSLDPARALTALTKGTIERYPDASIVSDEQDSTTPALTVDFDLSGARARQRFEARVLDSGEAIVVVSFLSPQAFFDVNMVLAQLSVEIDGDPLFAGLPSGPADGPTPEPEESPAPNRGERLDIAAIPFQPADIDGEGWGVFGGRNTTSLAEVAFNTAEARGGTSADNVAAFEERLTEWGWRRTYSLDYGFADQSNPDRYDHVVGVVIDEYDDAAGAGEGFAFFADTAGITAYDARPAESKADYGEESAASRFTGEISDTGEPFEAVAIDFRVGRLVATVAVIDYTGVKPKIAEAEKLAERLQARIESALESGTPDLGLAAFALTGDTLAEHSENYLRIDGETVPYVGETADDIAARDEDYGDADAVYVAFHQVAAGEDGLADDAQAGVWLYRFDGERAAKRWFAARREQIDLSGDTAPALGDDSFSYATEFDRGEPGVSTGYAIYVRVGGDVAAIEGVELDTVVALAEAQVTCLERGACRKALPVPDELADRAPAAEESVTPEETPTAVPTTETEPTPGLGRRDRPPDEKATVEPDETPVQRGGGADDVALFRGDPARTGVLPGPAPSGDPEVQWSFATGASVYASVAVVDGTVYATSNDGNLYALEAESGDEIWTFDSGDGQLSSPAVVGGAVYFGAEDDFIYAVDAATGEERWRFEVGTYTYASPAVVDGVVYAGTGAGLYALDAETGDDVWHFDLDDGGTFNEAAVVDGVVYAAGENVAVAIAAATGDAVWQHELPDEASNAPAVAGGLVFFACEDSKVYARDAGSGDEVWAAVANAGGDEVKAVAVAEGMVFAVDEDGSAYAFDADSGKALWTFATEGGFEYSSPVLVDGSVYLAGEDGSVYELDAETGEENQRIEVGSWLTGDTVVVNGWIYVAEEAGTIHALN